MGIVQRGLDKISAALRDPDAAEDHEVVPVDWRARIIGVVGTILRRTVWVGGVPLGVPRPRRIGVSGSTCSTGP